MAEVEYIPAGSALHQAFHAFSQEALKITAELNNVYHTPEEVRALMSQLTASEIDESFAMFPPFHSDCGKNTKIGKRVFINAGCQFQDQGQIDTGNQSCIRSGQIGIHHLIDAAAVNVAAKQDLVIRIDFFLIEAIDFLQQVSFIHVCRKRLKIRTGSKNYLKRAHHAVSQRAV